MKNIKEKKTLEESYKKPKPNKKVKNATEVEEDGIKFKSKLELYTYRQFKTNDISAEYQPTKFELFPGFTFCGKKYRPITLTPDFVGDNFVVEVKGHPNDVFPYKWKMFLWYLLQRNLEEKYQLFIVHSQKEVNECIAFIRALRNECNNYLKQDNSKKAKIAKQIKTKNTK